MKRVLLILLITAFQGFSQTQGISYQAVILSPTALEIPGVNAQGNILANSAVSIQFTIVDAAGSEEFQEYHTTSTDRYGMVNLLIGNGTATYNSFNDIVWDGTAKKLKVGIDFKGGSNYVPLSSQELTYMPSPVTQQTSQLIDSNTASIVIETNRATAAEDVNTTSISEEVIRATAAETTLQTNINSLTSNVATNATTAATATAAVQADVNANETASNTANIILQNNINTVQTDVDANETASNTAIAAVQSDVDANESDSDAVDATHTTNIATNATNIAANTSANTTTQSDVDQNETAANTAIAGVQTNVNNNEAASNTADTILQSNIDALSTTANAAIDLKANIASPTFTGTVSGITSAMVGLGNLDNTSDINKPVSTATQTALDLKADKNNPIFTGNATIGADLNVGGNMAVNGGLFLNSWDIYTSNSIFSINESGVAPSFNIIPGGNVGIGTTTPTANLEVAGTVKIVDGTQGLGKILTSDADGLASWKDAIVTAAKLAAVQTDVAANKTASAAADLTLTTNLATEAATARAAEEANATNISTLEGEQTLQNTAIGINNAKITYPGDQDLTGLEPIITTKNTAFNKDFGTAIGTVLQGDTPTISTDQANNITKNNAKITYPGDQDLTGLETRIAALEPSTTSLAAIGDLIEGGIVFWIDETGKNVLVCDLQDASSVLTRNNAINYYNPDYYNQDTGTGVFNDWYLPSKDELNLMWQNIADADGDGISKGLDDIGNLGGFKGEKYWSSTDYYYSGDWMVPAGTYGNLQHFKHGAQEWAWVSITYERHVRGIRAFTQTVTAGETNATAIEAEAATARAAEEANAAAISENLYFISTSQNDISTNTDAITNLQADQSAQNAAINLNSGKAVQISTNTDAITNLRAEQSSQNAAINLNSNKAGISSEQANEIVKNTAKVGQASGTTTGDMQYWNGTAWVVVAAGVAGQELTMNSGATAPEWVTPNSTVSTLAIGQEWQGGIIFYLDASGKHGLISAPTDQSAGIQWYNESFVDTYAYGNGIGAGEGNSQGIRRWQGYCSSCYASELCQDLSLGGETDWYLPSKYELNLMFENIGQGNALGLGNIGNFANNSYWSSTENGNVNACYQFFGNGNQSSVDKDYTLFVRAVRAF